MPFFYIYLVGDVVFANILSQVLINLQEIISTNINSWHNNTPKADRGSIRMSDSLMQLGAYLGAAGVVAMVGGAVAVAAGEAGEQFCPSDEGGPTPHPSTWPPRAGQELGGGAGGGLLHQDGDHPHHRRRGPPHLRCHRRPLTPWTHGPVYMCVDEAIN